ncbi:PepSY domain-containing protein [Streptomyces sp. NBC_01498]|uniref:PepSY domain-containing protein n=1 Tax=Streptomyces sp. NBC_01498 TaxID=2975870 RepID=UPI002E7ADC1D|nr:PepSY domain-containing protein [Streptomyces sp. NBC_01498]WTL24601.1 PepSY domain-containing protein [Streptomyces sp. NBC_01498]
MKRNLVIACVTAAALIGGGAYTAVATGSGPADGGTEPAPRMVSSASLNGAGGGDDDRGGDDGRDDRGDDRDDRAGDDNGAGAAGPAGAGAGAGKGGSAAAGTGITAEQAAAAALKHRPGTVASVDLDDDGDDDGPSAARHWEVDVIGGNGTWYDLHVDASTGAVRADRDDDSDDDDDDRNERAAVRGAKVDARQAAAIALRTHPGAVTSVDADDDRRTDHWDVTVRGDDGRAHAVTVDMSSGAVAAARVDDGDDDDRDYRADDRGDDDRGDDGRDDDGDDHDRDDDHGDDSDDHGDDRGDDGDDD